MEIRRLLTACLPDGRSSFAVSEQVVPIRAGFHLHQIWNCDELPRLPVSTPIDTTVLPAIAPAGGVRVIVISFPPGMGVDPDTDLGDDADADALADLLPEGTDRVDPNMGMHVTDSADIITIISGEICLEQSDGSEELLRPGDVVVQQGTRHAWRNRSTEPCVASFVIIGLESVNN